MKGMSPEALEIVKEGAPQFIMRVEEAAEKTRRHGRRARISLDLKAFYDDPMLLYASLWYAHTRGVGVFFPHQDEVETHSQR